MSLLIPFALMVSGLTLLVVQIFLGSIADFIIGVLLLALILFAFVLGRRLGPAKSKD